MDWNTIITILVTAIATHFFPEVGKFISARFSKTPQERKDESKHLSAKTESEIVKSANEIAAGSTVAVTNLLRAIEYLKLELVDARSENAKLEADVSAIKKSREESQANLTAALIESKDIRIDNIEKGKRIDQLERGMVNQGKYIDTLKTAMQKADIPVPLNGEVMDSVHRMQLSIEQRERLKAGK